MRLLLLCSWHPEGQPQRMQLAQRAQHAQRAQRTWSLASRLSSSSFSLSERMMGCSGLISMMRRPRMYSAARLSPSAYAQNKQERGL